MKVMNLLMMLSLVFFVSSGSAFAHGGHHGGHHHGGHYHDDPTDDLVVSSLETLFIILSELSDDLTNNNKVAILNANPDALGVLQGQAPTDLFLNGKAVIEGLVGTQFENDRQAALVILEYAEQYSTR